MSYNINLTKIISKSDDEIITDTPAFSQDAQDAINDFLQKYPVEIPLHLVLKPNYPETKSVNR